MEQVIACDRQDDFPPSSTPFHSKKNLYSCFNYIIPASRGLFSHLAVGELLMMLYLHRNS